MSLTSLALAERLNQYKYCSNTFFLPAIENHLDRMEISNPEVLVHTDYMHHLRMQVNTGISVTAFWEMEPVAIFGFFLIWEGVSESWILLDNKARAKPIAMTKYSKVAHDISKISMGLHRQQITVRITDKRATKWALALGFRQEAVMKSYGPDGVDYYLMARF